MTISDYNRRDRYWQYHELAKRVEKPHLRSMSVGLI